MNRIDVTMQTNNGFECRGAGLATLHCGNLK